MKTKDMLMLLMVVLILGVTGYVGYGQLKPKQAASHPKTTVEVVDPIQGSFDQTALQYVNDSTKVHDFAVPIDLNGLGNPTPFGGR